MTNKREGIVKFARALALVAIGSALPAQTFTTLVLLNGSNGTNPNGTLVQGLDGNFYGTTQMGGANKLGTVFAIDARGTLTTVYSFSRGGGIYPLSGLVLGTNGKFYGTTQPASTGNQRFGTVYSITPAGVLTTLVEFNGTNGAYPNGLIEATNGAFYGTTRGGGIYNSCPGDLCGTAFRITAAGAFTTVHNFSGADGAAPSSALVQAGNGDFYGTTAFGGAGYGSIFKMTPSGAVTVLANFIGPETAGPHGLVLASDGNFYGTTSAGGINNQGTLYRLTQAGVMTTLYNFCSQASCADGEYPIDTLIQGTDGNLYGTTSEGGANGWGTIFSMTTAGTLTTLHNFDGNTEGQPSQGALLQATDGNCYGTTIGGGLVIYGGVYRLSVGLGPFVRSLPAAGNTGSAVTILGTDLTGATTVSFHGTAAAFTVVSPTEISAIVPAGATGGKITVTTPRGTLVSNVAFRVLP